MELQTDTAVPMSRTAHSPLALGKFIDHRAGNICRGRLNGRAYFRESSCTAFNVSSTSFFGNIVYLPIQNIRKSRKNIAINGRNIGIDDISRPAEFPLRSEFMAYRIVDGGIHALRKSFIIQRCCNSAEFFCLFCDQTVDVFQYSTCMRCFRPHNPELQY